MTNLQKALQREILLFKEAIEADGGSIPEVSNAAFCKARKKLKPEAFIALSDIVTEEFYKSGQQKNWNGYRVIAVDGSTVELPPSLEVKAHYGVHSYRKDGKSICMGKMLMVYDALNHITLHGQMGTFSEGETTLFWKSLTELKLNKKDILVFDRAYASHLLFFYLQKQGVQFCFRMRSNWIEVQRFAHRGKKNAIVTFTLPATDKEQAAALGITETTIQCRLVRVELDNGETEILLTSLLDRHFSIADMKELYGLRWPVEESYKTFKHKVCIGNFSGKSLNAILQDFYVKIFIMNLTAVAIIPINTALKKESVKVKYTHQVNVIEFIATLKRSVASFFISDKISEALQRINDRISRITAPIRPGRKYKRHHQHPKKHHVNYKPV